ncbi:hypothetical protein [uncultured Methanoregula sp.]|uniref:hypothetical protein n=1 Tax=uncultured Methanoregula sp. TaxID=1005933 RepID=UPI002AAC2754|nr:hypothetical protein [uncultured Methanoregula sp.]
MKEETRWKVIVGIGLITLTLFLMTIHFLIFQDSQHLFIYLLGDLAFLPVEVLCVTLIIEEMLESRERNQRLEKLNMVIGIFFSRAGTPLLARFAKADPCYRALPAPGGGRTGWNAEEFRKVLAGIETQKCAIDPGRLDLPALREFLMKNEDFILRIVENPMVFEHESFTDLILAVTHLNEELKARDDLLRLPPADIAHLIGDMERVYSRLVPEWVKYMEYLQRSYPYLFSLAMRTNPFDAKAKVEVE